jgi:hypothetical protein
VSRAVAAGFLSVIRSLSARQTGAVAIDDWQWLDQPSRAVLEFMARRLEARLQEALALEDPLAPRSFIMRPSVIHGMRQLWLGEVDGALR